MKEHAIELSSGELAVEAAMEAELSGEDRNGDFALTVARLVMQPHRGGRGECGITVGLLEVVMAWWSGR